MRLESLLHVASTCIVNPPPAPRATSLRRRRFLLIGIMRHSLLLLGLAGALATMVGVATCLSPRISMRTTAWLHDRMQAGPRGHLALMDEAAQAGDHAATMRHARAFIGSIPRPHPADAWGEEYRRALRTFMAAAEAAPDLSQRLSAGELAVQFDPNDSVLRFAYGRALAAAGRTGPAAEEMEAAFRIRPTAMQVLHALESLPGGVAQERLAELRLRHLEALALCMNLPSWMTGNLVASNAGASAAFDVRLSAGGTVTLGGPLPLRPKDVYLVLPRLPELEVRIADARLIAADGSDVPLVPVPQDTLHPVEDDFLRFRPVASAGFDEPAVISFLLPADFPTPVRLEVRVECRPSPAVAAVMAAFGSWRHPGIKAVISD